MYKQHPGYSEKATNLFTLDLGAPEELPDALRGEKWSFVQLPLATLQQVRWMVGRLLWRGVSEAALAAHCRREAVLCAVGAGQRAAA